MFKKKPFKINPVYYQPKRLYGSIMSDLQGEVNVAMSRQIDHDFMQDRPWSDPRKKKDIIEELKVHFSLLQNLDRFQETDGRQLLDVLKRLRKLEDYLGVELKKTPEAEVFVKKSKKKKPVERDDDEEDD